MGSVNKVILVGNLGRDAELRFLVQRAALVGEKVAAVHQKQVANTVCSTRVIRPPTLL